MSILRATDNGQSYWDRQAYALGKLAADEQAVPSPSYSLSGLLFVSDAHDGRPWGMVSVPNAMVRGVFDALTEPGIQLPLNKDGKLDAHITVFRPEEIELLGGPSALKNDRGKPFRYSLGRLVDFVPGGWADMDRCWALRVHSPELQRLRRSHGLSSLPNDGKYDFHVTVAVRRKGVLGRNEKAKDTAVA